jgi:hypothetical protein
MRETSKKTILIYMVFLGLTGLSACNYFSSPTGIGNPSMLTQAPVSQGLTLTSKTTSETSTIPVYTLTALTPFLAGSNEAQVQQFNLEVNNLVKQEVEDFKASMAGAANPPIENGSYFNLKYTLLSPWGNVLSLKFDINTYFDGAAHPGEYSRTFTFDLSSGHQVNLDQLFLPGSNFLQVIADFCKTDLGGREIGFDASQTGADPMPDNYRNWNISADGVVITFDTYQVAAGAAGPQIVIIPYTKLQSIIDPNGPLAGFLK